MGKKTVKTELMLEDFDGDLKNSLWTAFTDDFVRELQSGYDEYDQRLALFTWNLWINFFKWPIDTLPDYSREDDGPNFYVDTASALKALRGWYFTKAKWYEIFDFIEFCLQIDKKNARFVKQCNVFLKKELSAYRIVGEKVVQITSEEEIVEIEQALDVIDKFSLARIHLRTALQLLADKKNPDFRNSMKESISAVEALCKIITGDKNATLGDSLKVIEKKYPLHGSLKIAFSALYGYTSDSGGIRHSLKDEASDLKFEDAKFMLVSCSAFVNYLIAKTT